MEWVRIDLGIFEFGLVNLIGVVRYSFMDSSCSGIVWVDLADSKTFDGICVDLGWDDLKGLRYSEDRFKLIFEGLGQFLWIRVKMATDLDGSRKIWMTLSGFDWIWGIWLVLGADTCGFLSWILLVIAGFRWIIKGFEWI